ncbi:MAG: hypothetical protein QOE51_2929 [Actinoplanes sp.]|jgi:hypothetical protein|nr:hypothetical protein [Actinoplanes sp.]
MTFFDVVTVVVLVATWTLILRRTSRPGPQRGLRIAGDVLIGAGLTQQVAFLRFSRNTPLTEVSIGIFLVLALTGSILLIRAKSKEAVGG